MQVAHHDGDLGVGDGIRVGGGQVVVPKHDRDVP